MIYRSKAPLRIGFAGGGTDVSPYSDLYGGAVLNATVSLYARAAIEPIDEPKILLQALDQHIVCEYDLAEELPADGRLELLKAVYNHFSKNYGIKQGFRLYTSVDAPPGSGLGSSSTLAVALTGAFAAWLDLPLGSYEIAHLAYRIERSDGDDGDAQLFGAFGYVVGDLRPARNGVHQQNVPCAESVLHHKMFGVLPVKLRLFGRIAARTVSESASGCTNVTSIPSFLNVLVNRETVPP